MKFETYTEQLEREASKMMALLRKVKETEVMNAKYMVQLYKGLTALQLEYAAAVWQMVFARKRFREKVWLCVWASLGG